MLDGHLIIDPPAAGAWNMAVDEALLESANETGSIALRFYEWAEPTLSLGYFQKAADRALHAASGDCEMVRRSSGGGAILHDRELTYSLSLPGTNRWSSKQNDLYGTVHKAVVDVLNGIGVSAKQFEFPLTESEGGKKTKPNQLTGSDQHRFLCFERRTAGDIVLEGFKIGGSAQRRLPGATLQHGSLLMKQSEFAPELPGIGDLSGISALNRDFLQALVEALAVGLNLSLKEASLTADQKKNAETILHEKYGNTGWTSKR